MKIKVSDRPDGRKQLDIVVEGEKVSTAIKTSQMMMAYQNKISFQDAQDAAKLKGTLLEKMGEAQYQAVLDNFVMNYFAPFAIEEKNLEIILNPDLRAPKSVEDGKEFAFTAAVLPKPRYELKSYDPITLKIPEVTVSEAEIDEQLVAISKNAAQQKPDPKGVIADGVEVSFSIRTVEKESGEELNQITSDSRVYKLGDKYLPEEFEQGLLGMKAGDSKDIIYELPGPMGPDGEPLPGKEVTSSVTIKQVFKEVIPAMTDAWVDANFPDISTVPELREEIRKQGIAYKTEENNKIKEGMAASELAERFIGSIPDEIYEFTRNQLLTDMSMQIKQQQGITIEQYIEQQGIDQQQFSMELMMQTRNNLRQGFALDALARHLGLSIDDDDIADVYRRMAPGKEAQAKQEFEGTGRLYIIREAALRTKANKWLVDTATIETFDMAEAMAQMQAAQAAAAGGGAADGGGAAGEAK
jgi:trigger factor